MKSFKGVNFGKRVQEKDTFKVINSRSEIPIVSIRYDSITNATGIKNDVIVNLKQGQNKQTDELSQVRLFVQEPEFANFDSVQGQGSSNFAKDYLKDIIQKSKLQSSTGEAVAAVNEVNFVIPRGKYSVNFYSQHFGLHGQTFSHRVEYKNILKGFFLPSHNQSQVYIVLHLGKPVTLGHTSHNFLVMEIRKDQFEESVRTNKDAMLLSERAQHAEDLNPNYEGSQVEVLVDLFHTIAGINLIQPGNNFQSSQGQPCIKGNIKAQSGWLYMLKQSLVFLYRPTHYIRLSEVGRVDFLRAGTSSKHFDIKLNLTGQQKPFQLSGIEKQEIDRLAQYFQQRQIEVKREQQPTSKMINEGEDDDDQSQDEDFNQNDVKDSSSSSQGVIDSQEMEVEEPTPRKKVKKDK